MENADFFSDDNERKTQFAASAPREEPAKPKSKKFADLSGAKDDKIAKTSLFFAELSPADRELVFDAIRESKIAQGQILYYENTQIELVYFLLQGRVKSYKVNRFDNEIVLSIQKEAGLICLYMPYDPDPHYFCNLEAVEASRVAAFERNTLFNICKKSETLAKFFHTQFAKKVDEMKHIINRDLVYDGAARVAHMLVNSIDEFNSSKRQEIARLLNIQPETLSRILTKFKRDLLIDEKNTDINVRDLTRLKNIYEI
ncbi:MAG: Crp/Fnr family transcriptional regulator [Helicobacteraceae bacterium]|jgi:CRP/FNR family transcriptional regulator|nr:Crp/Fnr family transcriptional regulator [Helicobacteraceae bacterium]